MHARFWVLSLIEAIKKAPQSPCIRFANDALYLLWFVDDGDYETYVEQSGAPERLVTHVARRDITAHTEVSL